MTSREGFDAYCLYLAINNHFNTESYDFFKYNGKVPVKLPAFLKRNDKYHTTTDSKSTYNNIFKKL